MAEIYLNSTESLLSLEAELTAIASVMQEITSQTRSRSSALMSRLEALITHAQIQVKYWQQRIDEADEDEDTSEYYHQFEVWEERLSVTRRNFQYVDRSLIASFSSLKQLDYLALVNTPKARAFIRQRVSEIENYIALKSDKNSGEGISSDNSTSSSNTDEHVFFTGYRRQSKDPRDWLWAKLYGHVSENLPQRVCMESFQGPAADQKKTPQCVCFSLAALKHHDEYRETRQLVNFDPSPIYLQCKLRDGMPLQDGTSIRDAMKVAHKVGMSSSEANRYYIRGYVRLDTVDEIRHALTLRKVVMLGINVAGASLSKLPKDFILQYPDKTDGGHCMLIVGYDDVLHSFRVRNSWGTEWGDAGHCWLPYNYLSFDPEFDAWTSACDKVDHVDEETTAFASPPSREAYPNSNFAWFNPEDVYLTGKDGDELEWNRITPDFAADSFKTITRMRASVDLSRMKPTNTTDTREYLAKLTDGKGKHLFTEDDLKIFDLYFRSDAIRIDGDGNGGYVVINGRHRLYLAQQLGIDSLPVSISNIARKQLIAKMDKHHD